MVVISISLIIGFNLKTPQKDQTSAKTKSSKKETDDKKSKSDAKSKKSSKKGTVKEVPIKVVPKHVFEVAKPIRCAHVEYVLFPDRPKYEIDVLCWGHIAKVFAADGEIVMKCFVNDDIAWVPITLRHFAQKFSDEEAVKFHAHVVDYCLVTSPAKLGKLAKTDKSKVFYIKESDVESTEKFIPAYPTDPNIDLLNEINPLEDYIRDIIWECSDVPGREYPEEIVTRLQFLKDSLHRHIINKTINKVIKKEKLLCKDFVPICPPPLTDEDLIVVENVDKNLKKKKGEKPATANKKSKEGGKKGKGKAAEGLKISVPAESFFTDPNYTIYKLTAQNVDIAEAFVITSAKEVMTRKQKYNLNPLVIKIKRICNLPVDILQQQGFKEIYAQYSVPYIAQCTTIKKQLNEDIQVNESHAHFLQEVPKLKLIEFMYTQGLRIEIKGERECRRIVEPTLFGLEKEDNVISTLIDTTMCRRILQKPSSEPSVITLAVAFFNLSSLIKSTRLIREIGHCHNPDCTIFKKNSGNRKDLHFIDTFTVNEVNLNVLANPKSFNPLTEEMLTTHGTTLSIEVSLSSQLQGVLEVFSYPIIYNRLLFLVNDINLARYFFHLIMLHNEHVLTSEKILCNYLKVGSVVDQLNDTHEVGDVESLESAITGFVLNNTKTYVFFIEGVVNGLVNDVLSDIKDSKRSEMKIFYNSNFLFERRIYPELLKFGGVYPINLRIPLFDILNQPLLYLEGNVPLPCWEALKKLDLLFSVRSFEVIHQYNVLPTARELISLDMEFGVPHKCIDEVDLTNRKAEREHNSKIYSFLM